jgi:hypothetical protein
MGVGAFSFGDGRNIHNLRSQIDVKQHVNT